MNVRLMSNVCSKRAKEELMKKPSNDAGQLVCLILAPLGLMSGARRPPLLMTPRAGETEEENRRKP